MRFLFPTIICILLQVSLGCEDGHEKQGPLRASGHSSGLTRAQAAQQQTQGPHLELPQHCQIRQLNPILGIHIQNPSPKYSFSASVDVCHHLSDSGQTAQVTAVASFPTAPSALSTCGLSSLGFLCHTVPTPRSRCCFLLLVTLKNMCVACNCPPTRSVCSERTCAVLEATVSTLSQLRRAGGLPSDCKIWITSLQLAFFGAMLASAEAH